MSSPVPSPSPSPTLVAGIPWPQGHVSDSVYFPTLFGILLTGVALCMLCTYLARWTGSKTRDRTLHYVLVAVMMSCLLVKVALDIEFLRDAITEDTSSTQLSAELTVSLAMSFIVVICSQMWLVYRVHVMSERYWPFTITGIVTVLASFISFVGLVITKQSVWTIFLSANFHAWFIAYAASNAVADCFLSSAYIYSVVQLRKKTCDPRFEKFLTFMLNVGISSFSVTAAFSVAMLVAVSISIENPIFSAFLSLLPAINCISVLYSLNSRSHTSVQGGRPQQPTTTHTGSTLNSAGAPGPLSPRFQQGHSPSSSMSQATANSGNLWHQISIEKSVHVEEDEPSPPSPSAKGVRQIPRKEVPRFV